MKMVERVKGCGITHLVLLTAVAPHNGYFMY